MKYLIVGLGNIGSDYEHTRHNIGFDVLDAFAAAQGVDFETKRLGALATAKHKGRTLMLLKPSTYMNLSGKAVQYWLQQEKIGVENLLVIVDDLNIDLGKLRLRLKGSDGGHNGLKDINATIGADYCRLRFGIGNNYPKGRQVDFVLGKWTADEATIVQPLLAKCGEIILSFATAGATLTMNAYNK